MFESAKLLRVKTIDLSSLNRVMVTSKRRPPFMRTYTPAGFCVEERGVSKTLDSEGTSCIVLLLSLKECREIQL